MEKENYTKMELQFNVTDIINLPLIHTKNVIEQIQYLYRCTTEFIPNEPYLALPTNNFPFIIHTTDGVNRNFDNLKNDSIQWIVKKGVEELILGINLCLSEAYKSMKYFEIVKQANKLWNEEKINQEIEKAYKDARKMHFPVLIDKIEVFLGQKLQMKEEILSMNKCRACLVHRNGVVSEDDVNSPVQLLNLKWFDYEFIVGLTDGTTTKMTYDLRKDGIEVEFEEIYFVSYHKKFNVGEQVCINIDEFNGLGITAIEFIRQIFDLVYEKITSYNYSEQGIDLKVVPIET